MHTTASLQSEHRETPISPARVTPHEDGRAALYALTAALLLPASSDDGEPLLAALRDTDVSQTVGDPPLAQALNALALAARDMDTVALADEYGAIFVDASPPQVDPSASKYCVRRSGNTLADVRAALGGLGLVRRHGIAEAEDHVGMLCEAMRLLVAGAPGVAPRPFAQQRAFFEAHLAPWYQACANDIRSARGANFFGRVADVMEAFLDVEATAFALGDIVGGRRRVKPRNPAEEMRHASAVGRSRGSAWPNRK